MSLSDHVAGTQGRARYAVLASALMDRINNGMYPVGSLLPTEMELCKQFGASRTTVREALRQLNDLGMVARRPGVGTRVRAKAGTSVYLHAVDSLSQIFQYPSASAKPRLLNHTEITLDEEIAQLLQAEAGQRWIRFETVRSFVGEGAPMAYVTSFVPLTLAGIIELVPQTREPAYTLIEKMTGSRIVEVTQQFKARRMTTREAEMLEAASGEAGLFVLRRYFDINHQLMLVTTTLYPSDRYSYSIDLRYNPRGNASE